MTSEPTTITITGTTKNGVIGRRQVKGWPLVLAGWEDWQLAVNEWIDSGWYGRPRWTVTELTTGLRLTGACVSRESAALAALAALERVGREKADAMRAEAPDKLALMVKDGAS